MVTDKNKKKPKSKFIRKIVDKYDPYANKI